MTENKSYINASVKSLEDDHPNGSFEVILSTPTKDRQGEVVATKAFEPLPASIPVHVDHNHSYAALVGRAVPRYEGAILLARGHYTASALAQSVREDVKAGNLDSVSVGFANPVRTSINGIPTVTKGELVEASFVSIPANRDTRVLAAKALTAPDASVDVGIWLAEVESEFI